MRLTQYTDYGLRVLIYLGLQPDSGSTISEVARAYDISRNHLMKVVQQLASGGFVDSRRGKSGGIRLARGADRIVVGNVVRCLESDFNMVECMRSDNACRITPSCKLRGVVGKARAAFLAVLDEYTLADLLGNPEQAAQMAVLLGLDEARTAATP